MLDPPPLLEFHPGVALRDPLRPSEPCSWSRFESRYESQQESRSASRYEFCSRSRFVPVRVPAVPILGHSRHPDCLSPNTSSGHSKFRYEFRQAGRQSECWSFFFEIFSKCWKEGRKRGYLGVPGTCGAERKVTNRWDGEAESQWIVAARLLYHLQYLVPYLSRLQRIHLPDRVKLQCKAPTKAIPQSRGNSRHMLLGGHEAPLLVVG